MGNVVAFASGGEGYGGLEPAGVGLATESPWIAEMQAMRRRLLRLALDVHDGPMQELIGIAWRLQSARARATKDAERGDATTLAAVFEDSINDLDHVEQGLRSLMFSLESNAASESSLRVPVEEHVAAFKRHGSAQVAVCVTGDVEPRTDSQRIALERVLRESLSNIAKHAQADHVEIALHGTDDSIVLEVRDDGCGFEPDANPSGSQHIGIRAMRERLRLLDGEFAVDSRVGGPTIVRAEIRKWCPNHEAHPAACVSGGEVGDHRL